MTSIFVIADIYASAIFDVALVQKKVDQWRSVLEFFAKISAYSIVKSLFYQRLEPSKLSNLFIKICEDLKKEHINLYARNFIYIISENNRFLLLPIIFEKFNNLCSIYYRRVVTIEVISAWPLCDAHIKKITFVIAKRLSKAVHIKCKINRNILAGIIIRIGDSVIDGSVRSRIVRLHNLLRY